MYINKSIKLVLIGPAAALIVLLPFYGSGLALHLAIIGMMGAIAALGLNIFYGYCGQINFGSAGFLAIGGYGVALLEKYAHIPYFASLIIAVVTSGIIAFVVSYPLLRLREHILALGTLAFGLALYEAFAKGFTRYTGGEDGIDISMLIVFGEPAGDRFFFYLFLICMVICFWISYAMRNSRVGRAMVSISQDEIAATSLGVNINKYLVIAFIISGMVTALSGGLFVKWTGWCSPEYFSLMISILILLAVVIGGAGSAVGALTGGLFMFILRELLAPLALYDVLAYGIVLTVFFLFIPQGITGLVRTFLGKWFSIGIRG